MILQDQQCSFFYLLHIPIDSTLFIVTQMVVIIQVLDPNINATKNEILNSTTKCGGGI
jgi:hypothetical protein